MGADGRDDDVAAEQGTPTHRQALAAAVDAIGGQPRPGQQAMADAVSHSLTSGEHLLVQAGTGTGKSLGYLIPVMAHLQDHPDERVVIATATLALQAQLAAKDIPAASAALAATTGREPRTAVVKGRSNYACLLRVRDGVAEEQATLIGADEVAETLRPSETSSPESGLASEVLALRAWAEEELEADGLADRDDAPAHGPRSWAQVSVPVRECLGATNCPYGEQCFVEKSRDRARQSDVVITNHALLAIDALHGHTALPEHTAVVIDEAHELVSRVSGAASAELSPQMIERTGRRSVNFSEDDEASLNYLESADTLRQALEGASLERVRDDSEGIVTAAAAVRDAARAMLSAMGSKPASPPEQRQAAAAVKEIFDVAERLAGLADADVVWVSERERFGRQLNVAPLSVAGLMRTGVLSEATTVLTSATLQLGGRFEAVAKSIGLRPDEEVRGAPAEPTGGDDDLRWRSLDVGTPFDYRSQGILYLASGLPRPGRDGTSPETLAEVAELVWAAGGRTLGLFASQRAAEAAARHVRQELPALTVLCQGEAHLPELTRRFAQEPETSLFGTVSLWQGVDVPGDTCELVIIDKIPFPRPDDPLMQARQEAVEQAGGNGFMAVAATHAALLLAQGAGRLIRRHSDRGVVAVLDPRLATARYAGFLRKSMPDFWATQDREVAIGALRRLTEDHRRKNGPGS
ncbi:ATP-dependent DNA helicase [Parenemella sanctibonifatiensis]|uniref:ATP-dependent helicase DinG n=1 Tax=Parenemella sanctibonifatiensis TaxID=2016505 RepID=A0A255EPJ8_9ACTN|nr:ATP-dependent helicase [Parenemella sanctibonifatiensis]OYN91250.1 ATP-dependent helicase [Parenemella sanctibonifatiensis]